MINFLFFFAAKIIHIHNADWKYKNNNIEFFLPYSSILFFSYFYSDGDCLIYVPTHFFPFPFFASLFSFHFLSARGPA